MRQLAAATETTTFTTQGQGYNYNLPNVEYWGQPETRDTGRTEGSAPPRLRQWFPETVLWRPEVITDDHGVARVNVDVADSITTWRLSASAVSAAGQLGASQSPLRVFQPFFVDVDLPVSLTRGDEIALPIVVHNYLDKPQSVTVTVDDAAWFQRLDAATKTVALGPSRSPIGRLADPRPQGGRAASASDGPGERRGRRGEAGGHRRARRPPRRAGRQRNAVATQVDRLRAAERGDRGERPLDRQDLSVELQPARRRARRHLSDAVRLLRADVVDDVSQPAGPRLSPPDEDERRPSRPRPANTFISVISGC